MGLHGAPWGQGAHGVPGSPECSMGPEGPRCPGSPGNGQRLFFWTVGEIRIRGGGARDPFQSSGPSPVDHGPGIMVRLALMAFH